MIFAQLPAPGAEELFTWLKAAVCIAGIYFLLLKIFKEHKREPSLDVEITGFAKKETVAKIEMQIPGMATKAEMQGMEKHLSEQLTTAVTHLDNRRSASIGNLHEQLKDAEIQLSAVKAETETHTRLLAAQDQKIDRILERLPRRA